MIYHIMNNLTYTNYLYLPRAGEEKSKLLILFLGILFHLSLYGNVHTTLLQSPVIEIVHQRHGVKHLATLIVQLLDIHGHAGVMG